MSKFRPLRGESFVTHLSQVLSECIPELTHEPLPIRTKRIEEIIQKVLREHKVYMISIRSCESSRFRPRFPFEPRQ